MENKDNQLLNLKVMRLSKPLLQANNPVLCERDDVISDMILPPTIQPGNNDTMGGGIEGLGMTSMLQLQSGLIYLGEIFTSYISLNNHSPHEVKNVELQTTTQRILLLDSEPKPIPVFGPGFNSDFVVQREVKEFGVNILCCAVTYVTLEGEVKKFKKFFKFQVSNPLGIKSKIISIPNTTFVEVCLENTTQGALLIDTVTFEAADLFTQSNMSEVKHSQQPSPQQPPMLQLANSLGSSNGSGWKKSTDSTIQSLMSEIRASPDIVFLREGNSRQYLFKVMPKDPNDFETKNAATLGKLDIVWRSYMGETGRLKTAQIQRKVCLEEVECNLVSIPTVELEKPFTVTAKIINKTNRILHPLFVLVRNKMDGILINGHLPKIGALQANSSINLDIEMFPLKPGMQQISGLAIKLLEPTLVESGGSIRVNPAAPSANPPHSGFGSAAAATSAGVPKNFFELGVLADVYVENNNSSSNNKNNKTPFFKEVDSTHVLLS
ncbi:DUF974 family protein [Cavenderia fasciculata]|uniref:DUF974 family protein n=1 Tax=Cavenderia fasciculata TaxID=261658 RepID=F4QC54_CACFS|nr:DUF974 family protein [Cavenderia fasciculata]EGG13541.1 DUF974 family protein [Cavenderia fasciculata]|eukprot:XP_004350245.1 DUF974 family protein [Cavenderia fasciculata]